MWHSQLSSSLNLGLLDPLDAARAAEASYRGSEAPLASVEGFIRQVIGWREYVWGTYRLRQEDWEQANALGARSALPEVFRGGPTRMRCLDDALAGVERTAYAHHIVRLMLFGNLMLLLGVRPQEASDWFQRSFIDGYEWVMAPNVIGMATWADGGTMMTKPYAASGRYVDRMSDYCRRCTYDPGKRTGEDACPFTTLYWDFLDRHRKRLAGNRRMKMPYRNLERIDLRELSEIRRRASALRRDFEA
ncbi:MAG: hypothetical protein JOY58_11365 [Solirubrobacterales bacterium]|nr:hypothetical protein [Solirubrobacterales bacterium]